MKESSTVLYKFLQAVPMTQINNIAMQLNNCVIFPYPLFFFFSLIYEMYFVVKKYWLD